MNYKIKSAIEKNKKNLIIYLMLWLLFTVALIIPVSHTIVKSNIEKTSLILELPKAFENYMQTLGECFTPVYIGTFSKMLLIFSAIFLIMVVISIRKNKSKNDYKDIEHGSSDWCEGGEQYSILSNKKGIILAEGNYLPVDKRGNVNVLIVGRFRFW